MNPTIKRYIVSSVTTFLTTFFIFIGTNLNTLDFGHLTLGVIGSFLMVAVRAAVKPVVEGLVGSHADPIDAPNPLG